MTVRAEYWIVTSRNEGKHSHQKKCDTYEEAVEFYDHKLQFNDIVTIHHWEFKQMGPDITNVTPE